MHQELIDQFIRHHVDVMVGWPDRRERDAACIYDGVSLYRRVTACREAKSPSDHAEPGGYPQGLQGDAISLEARIIRVADSLAAMTAHRPFRRAMSLTEAFAELTRYAAAARAAHAAGLQVNAGHDLNQANLTPFLLTVPHVAEVSIGHAFMADALEAGYTATVQAYLACINAAAIEST